MIFSLLEFAIQLNNLGIEATATIKRKIGERETKPHHYEVVSFGQANYKFDENGAKTVKQQLTGICKNIEIIDWERIFKKLGWSQPIKKGFDYTDYLVETKLAKERSKQIQQDTKER